MYILIYLYILIAGTLMELIPFFWAVEDPPGECVIFREGGTSLLNGVKRGCSRFLKSYNVQLLTILLTIPEAIILNSWFHGSPGWGLHIDAAMKGIPMEQRCPGWQTGQCNFKVPICLDVLVLGDDEFDLFCGVGWRWLIFLLSLFFVWVLDGH